MTHRTTRSLIVTALLALCIGGTASAAEKGWTTGGGIGMTASPTTFLMNFDALYSFGNNFLLGPQMQIGVTGGVTVVSAALMSRYDIHLSSGEGGFADFTPFVNGGIGLTYISYGGSAGPIDLSVGGTGFLIALGGGIEYRLSNHLSVETAMQFNIPASGAGPGNSDHFYWSWEMLGARYRF